MPAEKTPARAARSIASEIWKHFTKESPTLIRCKRCPKCFKRSSQYDSTTQFWNHMRLYHLDDFLTTQYCKEGLAAKNSNRVGKRLTLLGVQAGNGTSAIKAPDSQVAPGSVFYGGDVENEQVVVPALANAIQHESSHPPGAERANEPTDFPFTGDQRKLLEGWFQRIHSHWTEEQGCLADELGVEENTIKDWFHDRMGQEKRGSLTSDHMSLASFLTQADDDTSDLVAAAEDFEMAEAAGSEVSEVSALQLMDHDVAAIPDVHAENEFAPFAPFDMMLHLQTQQLQQSLFQPPHNVVPQPLPMPVPQVQPVENALVETCGRVMILRLRQLYEKDEKLFLRAQNDVNNAIFQYEDEGL